MGIEEQIQSTLENCLYLYNNWVYREEVPCLRDLAERDYEGLVDSFAELWYWIDMNRLVNREENGRTK